MADYETLRRPHRCTACGQVTRRAIIRESCPAAGMHLAWADSEPAEFEWACPGCGEIESLVEMTTDEIIEWEEQQEQEADQ